MKSLSALSVLPLFALGSLASARNEVLYFEDFESDDGGYTLVSPGLDTWEYAVPVGGPGAAHSGSFCWGTSLDGVLADSGSLRSPLIDVSAAAGDSGLIVSWWQYIDEASSYRVNTYVTSGPNGQHLFGRWYPFDDDEPVGTGWHRMRAFVGAEFTEAPLQILFYASGGYAVDDVRVERARLVSVHVEDFEDGPGGFDSDAVWAVGKTESCPWGTYDPPSGENHWGTSLPGCGYPPFAENVDLLSRPVDLTPFQNRHEVVLHWMRSVYFEGADGGLHAMSFDGGETWSDFGGRHWGADGDWFGTFVGYGVPLDPAVADDVVLRFRFESDSIESEYGMWIDDFTVAVPEDIPGSGANAPGSLRRASGAFELGAAVTLEIDDPADSFAAGSIGLVLVSLQGDAQLPAGTSIPGWSLSSPGSAGDLLVDVAPLAAFLVGSAWSPAQPSEVQLAIPNSGSLLGVELYLQGLLVDLSGPSTRFGATTGLFEKITD